MTAILLAMVSVAAKDAFGVLSTIAMARGRALISGGLDVGYEAAFIFTAAFGAGPVIKNGLTQHSLAVIAAVLATAFFTASVSTRLGNRMRSENDPPTSLPTSPRASPDRAPFLRRRHLRCLLRALPPRFDITRQDSVPGMKMTDNYSLTFAPGTSLCAPTGADPLRDALGVAPNAPDRM